jgi:hypothetical protein
LLLVDVGYCCWLCCASGNTLLAIVVGLWGASDNALHWVLLWVMRGFVHHTLLGIITSDVGRLQNYLFFKNNSKVKVSVFVSPPKLLMRISAHKQNHMALIPSFLIDLYKRATIRQISYSQTCTFPQTVRRTGIS